MAPSSRAKYVHPGVGEASVAQLSDVLFVALARKLGKPAEAELHRIHRVQLEKRTKGESRSMFELACLEKALDPTDVARFERWASQIERRDQGAIEDSDAGGDAPPARPAAPTVSSRPALAAPPPSPPPLPKKPNRVLAQSAATFGAAVARCALCSEELDELAILEHRAREVEGGFACQKCLEKFAAPKAPAPGKTPTAREPAAAPPAPESSEAPTSSAARTPSAGRLGTPSRRRVAAARSADGSAPGSKNLQLLLGAGALVVGGFVVGLLVLAGTPKSPTPQVAVAPSPVPSPAPASSPSPVTRPGGDPAESDRRAAEEASRVATETGSLVREGRTREALARIDAALARIGGAASGGSRAADARTALLEARGRTLDEIRRRIERVRWLADEGDTTQAKALADRLRTQIPRELAGSLAQAVAAVQKSVNESAPSPSPRPREGAGPVASASPRPSPSPDADPTGGPNTTTRPSPEPSPRPSPEGTGEDGAGGAPKAAPSPGDEDAQTAASWMDDTASSLPWDQAYTVETEHFVIKTSVARKHIANYQKVLETLAQRYSAVFHPPGSQSYVTKWKLSLYGSQEQFLANEPDVDQDTGGFYRPGGARDLHCFHGPWSGVNGQAVSVLAHETGHAFQHLASQTIFERAPTFLTEGLSTFFEAPRILPDGTVLLGSIPTDRLHAYRRAIKAGEPIPLATLIRTPSKAFLGSHYAPAWALVHWCFYGPEGKKSQKLLDWFWETCCTRAPTAEDFEEGVRSMGYTMPMLDKAVRDWVLKLDPKNDPAVLLYEKETHKKVPR